MWNGGKGWVQSGVDWADAGPAESTANMRSPVLIPGALIAIRDRILSVSYHVNSEIEIPVWVLRNRPSSVGLSIPGLNPGLGFMKPTFVGFGWLNSLL